MVSFFSNPFYYFRWWLLYAFENPFGHHHLVHFVLHRLLQALKYEDLVQDFENRLGSRKCSGILGCNISTREGEADFKTKNLMKTVCLDATVQAAGLVMEVLDDQDNIKHSMIG